MAEPYQPLTSINDVENLTNQSNELLDKSVQAQNQAVDLGVQKAQQQTEFNKQQYDKQADEQARALYTDYKKQSSQYGANAEQMLASGLGNSGYSESSQVNMYNSYQKNYTSLINETNKLKAEADQQLTQAMFDADINKAQIQASMYTQKISLALQEYQLKFQQDQFAYQRYSDALAQDRWEKEYALNLESHNADMALKNMQIANAQAKTSAAKTTTTKATKTPTKTETSKTTYSYPIGPTKFDPEKAINNMSEEELDRYLSSYNK